MRHLWPRVARVIATWFGCGLVPGAPGTLGTLGAVPLYWLVSRGGSPAVALAAVVVTAVGIFAASTVQLELGIEDPQIVVVDEVAGLLVTMIPIPVFSWKALLAGVVLFRVLDIWKPWPIRRFEDLPLGLGIMMDDVAAGAIGAVVMAVLNARGVFG